MIDTAQRARRAGLRTSGGAFLADALRWSLAAILALSLVSLVCAMANLMMPWLVLPLSAIATVWVARHLPTGLAGPVSLPVVALVVVVLVGFAAFGIARPHEHVLGGRDPGTYVGTASWIATHGGLWMNVGDPVLADTPLVYETLGFPSVGPPELLRPQFLHLFPSLMAVVASTAGHSWVFLVTPVIGAVGLLALFAFSRSVVGEWSALLVTLFAGISLPFYFFYRAPFSELLSLAFLFGGLWALERALARRSMALAVGSGLFFGGVLATRIDGVLVLLGLTAYLVYLQWTATDKPADGRTEIRIVETAWRVSVALLLLAVVDAIIYSPAYLSDHGRLMGAVVAAALGLKLFGARLGAMFQRSRRLIAGVTTALLTAFLLYAAVLRPLVASPTRDDIYGITGLQEAAGVTVEPLRTYAELSVHWLSWYLGIPLLATGMIALVFLTRRLLLGRATSGAAFIVIVAMTTVVYVVRPSINPDHIWAMRRFLPVVIPGLLLLAVALWEKISVKLGRWRPIATVGATALAAATLLPPTIAVGTSNELEGAAGDLSTTCSQLGSDSIVLIVGERSNVLGQTLAPTLRGWCGATVALESQDEPLDTEQIAAIASRASASGKKLWMIGDHGQSDTPQVVFSGRYEYLELTLFRPPDTWLPLDIAIDGVSQ